MKGPSYLRVMVGRLAEVHGIRASTGAGKWLLTPEALKAAGSGLTTPQLRHWAKLGIISVCRDAPGEQRRYLAEELAELAELPTSMGKLSLLTVREHIARREALSPHPKPAGMGDEDPDGWPRERLGQLAKLCGIEPRIWVTPKEAVSQMVPCVNTSALQRWADLGIISSRRWGPGRRRYYLHAELVELRRLCTVEPLRLWTLRQHLAELERQVA